MVAEMARLALVLLVGALAVPATASAAVPEVWATVNVCDTAKHPNAIGIRASMPGAKRRSVRLYMRFRVQWKDPTDGLWHNLIDQGDSGFISVGRPKGGARRQGGFLFPFEAPAKPLRLRGRVDFDRPSRVAGLFSHPVSTFIDGFGRRRPDPKGYSAATCLLR